MNCWRLWRAYFNLAAIALNQKPRSRAVGGGRKARLQSVEEKLFFILFYIKCDPTFDVAGVLFDRHRSRAHRWMLRLQPVLEIALGKKMVLPARKLESVEEFIARLPLVKEVITVVKVVYGFRRVDSNSR